MPYTLTPEQSMSITDAEMAFSTTRLLPKMEEIPAEFFSGNEYTELVSALFYGSPIGAGNIEIHDGFTGEAINRVVHAHLKSFAPKHEHKIAGVGYMLSLMCTLPPTKGQTP